MMQATTIYAKLFAKPKMRKLNYLFLKMGLKGLGFLNFESHKISGEHFVLKQILKKLAPKVIFDVGGFHGTYAKQILGQNYQGELYVFEPHPLNYKELTTAMAEHSEITIENIGFSNKPARTQLYDYDTNQGSSHATLYRNVITEVNKHKVTQYDIALDTIDNYMETKGIEKIDFLKIDAEGHEHAVLSGANKALSNSAIDVIQFELGIIGNKILFKEYMNILADYDLYRILPNNLLPVTYSIPHVDEIIAYQNILAVHKTLKNKFK